jgi:hypothetical protein
VTSGFVSDERCGSSRFRLAHGVAQSVCESHATALRDDVDGRREVASLYMLREHRGDFSRCARVDFRHLGKFQVPSFRFKV